MSTYSLGCRISLCRQSTNDFILLFSPSVSHCLLAIRNLFCNREIHPTVTDEFHLFHILTHKRLIEEKTKNGGWNERTRMWLISDRGGHGFKWKRPFFLFDLYLLISFAWWNKLETDNPYFNLFGYWLIKTTMGPAVVTAGPVQIESCWWHILVTNSPRPHPHFFFFFSFFLFCPLP